jgi:ligand-binding sensor domain-containing protein/class 3 adenylate cyclase
VCFLSKDTPSREFCPEIYVFCLFLLIIFSCTRRHEHVSVNISAPKVLEVKGSVVPRDSLAKPQVILSGKPRVVKAGNPKIIPIKTNIHPAGVPKLVKAGTPKIDLPGHNNYSLPKNVTAIESPVIAGTPEVVIAKEAHIMENNPQNFSSFGKLQGLKANTIYCITQDNIGNIWFGTTGGITRYDGNAFTHFMNTEGLCNNVVLSILHDKKNNLWIGTKDLGIFRFDGKRFTRFSEKEGLLNNYISAILEDKSGNLWFGTKEGVVKYDGKSFTHFTEKEGLINNLVFSICEDIEGNLWFGTAGGVSKYNGQSFSNFTDKEGLCNNEVRSILQDKSGNIWLGTAGGVSKYDGRSFTRFSEKEGLSNNTIFSILEDISGNLWFGTWGEGAYKYDGNFFAHFTEKEGLINDEIYSIFQDKSGIMWFGTRAGGAGRYNGNSFDHFTCNEGLSHNQIQSILKDKNGNLWFGTWGAGVCKYDGKSFSHFTEKEGLINNDVRSIMEDKNGYFWFGTWGGVSKFDGKTFTQFTEKEGLCGNIVMSMLQDMSGNLWFGTEGKGVSEYDGKRFIHFDTQEGLSGSNVRSMMQDKNGNIWFGTNGGVTKYDPSEKSGIGMGSFTHYTETEGLPNNNIISVLEDQCGNIWFGSSGGGVIKYDGSHFNQFTEKEGLCNNGVMSILEDKGGNLWFGTRTGISRLVKESIVGISDNFNKDQCIISGIFKNYTYEDGFYGVGCNSNSICEDNDGAIWIGANDRLTVFHPGATDPDTLAPNIQLTGIELFNAQIPWAVLEKNKDSSIVLSNGVIIDNIKFDGLSDWYNIPENLTLGYSDNFIKFNFIGITTKSTQNVKYQYTLDGLDKNWITITDQTSASYGHLPDARYTFRVKAMNSEGYWSDDFIYNFTIRPPWWKTSWAFLLYAIGFIMGIILIDRIQTQRVIAKERERIRDRELEHAHEIEKAFQELHLQNEIVEKQNDELEMQKKRSDELLLNILPAEVAEELKAKGSADAKLIDEVTVLFTDFMGFTRLSEKFTPKELVAEIHECFSAFDYIIQKHGIEKIKTIGDSYMAAGGLPLHFPESVKNTVKAGVEMLEFMIRRKQERELHGHLAFEMRIGIHTGPVVAGIVGVKKFQYDIWGDTVNTAARMEDKGEIRKVNISQSTYELIKDDPDFRFEYRGKIEAKHKGELDMYFVDIK